MPDLSAQEGLFTILKDLSDLPGASGAEGPVRDYIARSLKGHVDDLRVDALGNLIAFKKGTEPGSGKLALLAHMDEVGLIVTGADDQGYLKFDSLGGVDPHVLIAKRVKVGPDAIPGVIGYKPIHLQKQEEREKRVEMKDLRVDIGAKDEKEALGKAPLGTVIHFDMEAHFIGEAPALPEDGSLPERGRFLGKAFDDRVGCMALIAVLRGPRMPYDLYGIFTILEEEGLRGAKTAAWKVEPDAALVLESTVADDLPREEDLSPTTRLGHGPAVTVMDKHTIADPRLTSYLLAQADEAGIPIQVKQPLVGGTDARVVQLSRGGVPVAILAVPSRYIHSPVSVIEMKDVGNLLRLLDKALPGFPVRFDA
jgi:endoglucanase